MQPRIASWNEQFEAIRNDATSLTAGLSDAQLLWRPHPSTWSIAENLAHLNSIDGQDLPQFFKVITQSRKEGRTAEGPFRWNWFERWFIGTVEPPFKMKVKAPRKYQPQSSFQPREVVLEFLRIQHDLAYLIREADGLDLKNIKVVSPAAKWLKMSLGARIDLIAAHDRRHLWSARRVRETNEFPS